MHNEITNFKRVQAFHKLIGITPCDAPVVDDIELAFTLIAEEAAELAEASADEYDDRNEGGADDNTQRRVHVAKEIADLLYVVYGLAHRYSFDIDAVFAKVHESNMTKFCYSATELTQSMQALQEKGEDVEFNQQGWTEGGKPIYVLTRVGDGKVLKSINYKDPIL